MDRPVGDRASQSEPPFLHNAGVRYFATGVGEWLMSREHLLDVFTDWSNCGLQTCGELKVRLRSEQR